MLTLSHYTEGEGAFHFEAMYVQHPQAPKPHGLWLSADGPHDWPAWCKSENFRLEKLRWRHVFEIVKPDRIMHLTEGYELDAMTMRFPPNDAIPPLRSWTLDWQKIAETTGGLLISPYQWSRRLTDNTRWYYGWDCASGCVWDLSALRYVSSAPFDVEAHVALHAEKEDAE